MEKKQPYKTSIGGQALIEGVLMRGPSKTAISVRKPDGEIETVIKKNQNPEEKYPFLSFFFIRGISRLITSMVQGIQALTYSASFWDEEEEKDQKLTKEEIERKEKTENFFSFLLSLVISIVFFIFLPTWVTNFFRKSIESTFFLNLLEGMIRIVIFFLYLFFISKIEELYRLFQYHGAEHKTIHCYENGDKLTVENIRKYPLMHPRCGTSFLFMVLMISILVHSFFGWPNPLLRTIIRLLTIPIVAGIAYEVNRVIGKYDTGICKILRAPGMKIQQLVTVKEPDDSQIEVAVASFLAVLPEEGENDQWK